MNSRSITACLLTGGLAALAAVSCNRPSGGGELELRRLSLDTAEGLIQRSGVEVDRKNKAEGAGSLKVTVGQPSAIPLFETGPLDIDDAVLVYRAKLRTEKAEGNVYLEMWCDFAGKGEFFSRGLTAPLRDSTAWTTREIQFFLKPGEKPDNVKLNVVSEGTGLLWIDDIRLLKRRVGRPAGAVP